MKKVLLVLAACVAVSASALAQGPGGGGMPPEIQKMMAGFQKYAKSPKGQLGTTMRALSEFANDPKTKFTKPQAQKLLAIYGAWKSKPSMNQEQAAQVNKQITGTFSIAQIKKQAMMGAQGMGGGRPGGGGMGGGRPGGGGMGGGRPGGGGPGGFDPKRMAEMQKRLETMNPFNIAAIPDGPWKERTVKGYNATLSALQAAVK